MRLFKKILKIIAVLLILILISGWVYYSHLKPSYSGNLELSNIEKETSVYFDDYGITHIYAENEFDAITTLGYVHAQDRLWQMELINFDSEDTLKFHNFQQIHLQTFLQSLPYDMH